MGNSQSGTYVVDHDYDIDLKRYKNRNEGIKKTKKIVMIKEMKQINPPPGQPESVTQPGRSTYESPRGSSFNNRMSGIARASHNRIRRKRCWKVILIIIAFLLLILFGSLIVDWLRRIGQCNNQIINNQSDMLVKEFRSFAQSFRSFNERYFSQNMAKKSTNELQGNGTFSNINFASKTSVKNLSEEIDWIRSRQTNLTNQLLALNTRLDKLLNSSTATGCPKTSYFFPRKNQTTDYVRYRGYFPNLSAGTICMWVRTINFANEIITSYATSDHDNEIGMRFVGATTLRTWLSGIRIPDFTITSIALSPMNHICMTFSTSSREVMVYVNGLYQGNASYLGPAIIGGGSALLGQEQDGVDAAGLDASQAFMGTISNFMIWNRVLHQNEVTDMVNFCNCPADYSVILTPDRTESFGGVNYNILEQCPTMLLD